MKKIVLTLLVLFVALVLVALGLGPAYLEKTMNSVSPHSPYSVSERAKTLHASLLIGDWHADSALWDRDLSKEYDYGHADIPRMQQGNMALQMFTTVTKSPAGQNYDSNKTSARDNITSLVVIQGWPIKTWNSLTERALFQAEKIHNLARRDGENFMVIQSQTDLAIFLERRALNPSLIGGLLGTEGSHALDGNVDNIQRLYDSGFRMMSLQHFFDNKLGGSLHGLSGLGLTEFGRQAVTQMLALDIMIDVSHSSESVVRDTLGLSDQPLLVSHTGFQGHCDSPRNISDLLMQKIAEQGGLIAVGFWDGAICDNTPKSVAAAINYGIQLVGADHVALGSDFDGSITPGFDTSELVAITHELLESGATESQIRQVMGGNMVLFLQNNLPKH
ncbi:MAG: dipeptidase [Porticoccaceae bacterium]|mgnify:FL=1|nr:dipeptidase [Porticoccaceae bacterium]